ncbi:MAG: hypothetical protein AAF387_10005 [Pseudomonadota bacterium]
MIGDIFGDKSNKLSSLGAEFSARSVATLDVLVNTVAAKLARFQEVELFHGQHSGNSGGGKIALSCVSVKDLLDRFDKEQEKAKDTANWMLVLDSLNERLANMEADLEERYGKYFALDMVADLVESGHVTQEEYDRLAAYENDSERRQEIAILLQAKRENGELPLNRSWAREWLDMQIAAKSLRDRNADRIHSGDMSYQEAGIDAVDKVKEQLSDTARKNEAKDATADAKANEDRDDTCPGLSSFTF